MNVYRSSSSSRLGLTRALTAALALTLDAGWSCGDTILNSKHDLSTSGPGPIKASVESEVCLFCHTPHRAIDQGPLWNHAMSRVAHYTPYSSSSARAAFGQPTGASKLCLSCHDGTVAIGEVNSRPAPIAMQGGVTTMPGGDSNLQTDLSDDHPFSFAFDSGLAAANGELRSPEDLTGRVRLDRDGQLQCTSCHDPHDNQFGKFLVMDNHASTLCTSCHDKRFWTESIHRSSAATWNGTGLDPWPHTEKSTVSANACENCHAPHGAGIGPRLMTQVTEESNCYACHNGNVVAKNIQLEFAKSSMHPIAATAGVHIPREDLINPPRHVECADCHNPHASKHAPASAPAASGALAGVAGINAAKATVDPIANEYELCFRCHADSIARGPARVPRVVVQTNTRLEFAPTAASYHPVEAVGKNPDVPSMIGPTWTRFSRIYCTDCHNNDDGPGTNGTGPRGPHGSIHTPLLERRLDLLDGQKESAAIYALCYKCHERTSILEDRSFKEHHKHVDGEKTACTTCHDPHGVEGTPHLINFNRDYVTPSSSGRLEFIDDGQFRGTCYLKCHGEDHNPESYQP